MTCPNCGFQNQEGSKFCASCGTPLSATTSESLPPAQTSEAVSAIQPMLPPPAPASTTYPVTAPKSKATALILEILPGLFGFLGFGWIYAGETQRGIMILIGYIVFAIVSVITITLTVGFGCLICLPLLWGAIAYSAYKLNLYTKARPELFTS